ncbi:MAG: type II toxin-antitoxin system VapC family toxin [Actinomycetota bacterium]|nr:type II toxin-antitoxin system VapC family toxin [Actinomycetota bacterium]
MIVSAVLDAAAFDVIDTGDGAPLRQLLRSVMERGGDVRCAAVTLAEVCRGPGRTRRVEVAVTRDRGGQRVLVIPTDERLAKLVGTVLHAASRSSNAIADAHVVAVCAGVDAAVVITSDPEDINELATAIPGTRIITRRPQEIASRR